MSALERLIAALVAGMLIGGAAAWGVQGWRIDAIKADAVLKKSEAVEEEKKRGDQIGNDYAEVVRWLNERKQERTVAVVKELEKPVYSNADCRLPDTGRMLINSAVREANATRLGGTVLSEAPGGAAGGVGRGDAAVVDMGSGGLRGMLRWQGQADRVGNEVGAR